MTDGSKAHASIGEHKRCSAIWMQNILDVLNLIVSVLGFYMNVTIQSRDVCEWWRAHLAWVGHWLADISGRRLVWQPGCVQLVERVKELVRLRQWEGHEWNTASWVAVESKVDHAVVVGWVWVLTRKLAMQPICQILKPIKVYETDNDQQMFA